MWKNPATYAAIFSGITTLIAITVVYRAIKGESRDQGKREGRVDAFMEKVEQFIGEMKEEITQVKEQIGKLIPRISVIEKQVSIMETTGSNSPRVLNDLGKKVSQYLNASDWAEEQGKRLFNQVKNKEPYEVETFSFEYVDSLAVTSAEFNADIQRGSYENGTTIGGVKVVYAIELRDALLELQKQG